MNYEIIEKNFNVIYPENDNATYVSNVNYSDDLKTSIQRWYRYKEGFSIELVKHLIKTYMKEKNNKILDPFMGSGSTLIAANELGYEAIGFEVNPFSHFLSEAKLTNYSLEDVQELKQSIDIILNDRTKQFKLPTLSFADAVFSVEVMTRMMEVKYNIYQLKGNVSDNVFKLLKLGWISAIEELSNYRKAGNGLKKRKLKNPIVLDEKDVIETLSNKYQNMIEDICANTMNFKVQIFNDTCLNMRKYLEKESISGIIFSPPYANCFDYTEIYKLELWFGDFVTSYEDMKKLRKVSLRSHLNADLKSMNKSEYTLAELEFILAELKTKKLWDKKIPTMLQFYFQDMFEVIQMSFELLEKDGFCNIVVSNSAYGGLVIPTDLLFCLFAEKVGFEIEKIEVARYIITSSQQYNLTLEQKKYLRESIICLKKK